MTLTYSRYVIPTDDSIPIARDGDKTIYYVDHDIDVLKEYDPEEALGLVTDLVDDTVEDLNMLNVSPNALNDVDFDIMNKSCSNDKKKIKLYNTVKERIDGMNSKIYRPVNGHIMFLPRGIDGQNERLFFSGQSGSGKSKLCGEFGMEYRKGHPYDPNNEEDPGYRIFLFSRKDYDKAYDDKIPGLIRIPLNRQFITLTQRPAEGQSDPIEKFADSLLIFDDFESIQVPEILKAVIEFKNSAFQLGRQYNIDVCSIQHKSLGGSKTVVDLCEANILVMFPKANLGETTKILQKYCHYDKQEMARILDEDTKKERWIAIIRPNILISEHFIKVLN